MLNIYFSFGSISQHYKYYLHTEVLLAHCPATRKIFNLGEKVLPDQKYKVSKCCTTWQDIEYLLGLNTPRHLGTMYCNIVLQGNELLCTLFIL